MRKKVFYRFLKKEQNKYQIEIKGVSLKDIQDYLIELGISKKNIWMSFDIPQFYDDEDDCCEVFSLPFKRIKYQHYISKPNLSKYQLGDSCLFLS